MASWDHDDLRDKSGTTLAEANCKGDISIGSGCRKCPRCKEQLKKMEGIFFEIGELPAQQDQWDEKIRGKKMSDATGRVIFKYQMPVLEQFTMRLPKGAEIIRMQDQGGMFWLWAMVRTDVPDEERKFWAFKCGGKIPDDLNLRYVGFCAVFVQQELGLYIFEEIA
jgi:hypothetical protein